MFESCGSAVATNMMSSAKLWLLISFGVPVPNLYFFLHHSFVIDSSVCCKSTLNRKKLSIHLSLFLKALLQWFHVALTISLFLDCFPDATIIDRIGCLLEGFVAIRKLWPHACDICRICCQVRRWSFVLCPRLNRAWSRVWKLSSFVYVLDVCGPVFRRVPKLEMCLIPQNFSSTLDFITQP